MQERGKANFSVDNTVVLELAKHILRHMTKRVLRLHQLKSFRRALEELGKICALARRHVITVVLFASNRRGQMRDGLIAQRAVKMKMQFDLWQRAQIHRLIFYFQMVAVYFLGKASRLQ